MGGNNDLMIFVENRKGHTPGKNKIFGYL